MERVSRRAFVTASALALTGCGRSLLRCSASSRPMRVGLVTYQWGKDWDLPTLLANCKAAGMEGVELRTTHRHGVEPSLSAARRREVRARFADSPVALVGLGSVVALDSPDPAQLQHQIEDGRAFVLLSRDVGSSGVKIRPNSSHEREGVPREKTLEQIGRAFGQLARFAADYGQEIRMEMHGDFTSGADIRRICQIADHPNARVCWNCNPADTRPPGLVENFQQVRPYFGATLHTHDLDNPSYPCRQLAQLLVQSDYRGWILFEESRAIHDPIAELSRQRKLWESWTA